jgi:peptidoglycan hydrolase CwlO-like protein
MADAGGSQQLIEEHAGNLVGEIETLVDLLLDAEATIEEQAKRIDLLETELGDAEEELQLMYERITQLGG